MANSDYIAKTGNFGFCPTARLVGAIGHLDTAAVMTGFSASFANALRVGMAAMIDDEIVSITAATGNNLTLGRGCCDTIPAAHAANSIIWFFDDSIGSVDTEYTGSETVSVKMLPRTSGGGAIPIEHSPPKQVGFNFRFARPYPPGQVKVNGLPWYMTAHLTLTNQPLALSWVHRNRITQQDQLIAHIDGNIAPEFGTTYVVEIVSSANVLLRTFSGITGDQFNYELVDAIWDFGNANPGTYPGYLNLYALRDGMRSFQAYRIDFDYERPDIPLAPNPPFGNVLALLDFEGANDSAVVVDRSSYARSVSVVGALLKTADPKVGSSALAIQNNGAYCRIAHHSDFDFGASDFTIEGVFWSTDVTAVSENFGIFGKAADGANRSFIVYVGPANSKIQVVCWHGAGSAFFSSDQSLAENVKYHIALEQWNGRLTLYVNGAVGGFVQLPSAINNSTVPIDVGTIYSTNAYPNQRWKGVVDEVRVANVAVYKGTFIPRSIAMPIA